MTALPAQWTLIAANPVAGMTAAVAVLGAPAGADHDGRGGSQAQRTRARDRH
ncbi:hypothetical protein ABLO09_05145 [Mycobacterium tuberculosis]